MSAYSIVKENEEHEDQKSTFESNQAQISSIQRPKTPPKTPPKTIRTNPLSKFIYSEPVTTKPTFKHT